MKNKENITATYVIEIPSKTYRVPTDEQENDE